MPEMVWAIRVVKKRFKIDDIDEHTKHIIMNDVSAKRTPNPSFDNMAKALDMFAQKGWECVNITANESNIYALMKRVNNQ